MKVNDTVKSHLNLKLILSLFVKMFKMPYMSLQQADTFMVKIGMFWGLFLNKLLYLWCVCTCAFVSV